MTGVMVLVAFPLLTAALFGLAADRHLGAHIFDPANGATIAIAALSTAVWAHHLYATGAVIR